MSRKEKVLAVLSYLGILALVPIFWMRKSDVLKTHSDNGLVILFIWIILLFIFQLPFVGVLIGILLTLGALICVVWGIVDAIAGKEAKIPGLEKVVHLIA